ncbi:hypothetical protein DICPUDRAFT_82682 [Dictyostelium purpureum]|uniref:ASCH domain-containing protein n=1 Tax=Dictyostelium purpureum TaxID=5786 RepID=F0ZX90_DICPU|nr:uncharacterized protein DICPUDRAFT_82682 [Dictyostelium purpureum]EGC31440.1 hypothetical protein DICPUDRAFT_82682 [Dictyostelium purpureum]|eukprot:XP_003292039.1 hypothetical protein DICPUDRAFT_82682 [Dictyostelium purpureum]
MKEKKITFYGRFESDILKGLKTITIRNRLESHYSKGEILNVYRYEDNVFFCTIEIDDVSTIDYNQLNDNHAKQENMTLDQLKEVINNIYPGEQSLYVLSFHLVN